ncbi:hypothetical protein [Chamaesiphon polymorphus]|uniref:Uncharacterized protein n=1 Tax=Chamaesiphon polymorphus CCALA 037 TaxID=2107692 RepID=A0A2T1GLN7_9CYAN|nr:hypothetical protein [Chamaesiphon polymorphus]PSB58795.1 hypothetical protein C7B77_03360 [Chamaesiphon polymorphus CCALA 037]
MMKNTSYFDRDKFIHDVIELLKIKHSEELTQDDEDFEPVFASGTDERNSEEITSEEKARELLKQQDIRQFICPFIQGSTNDIFDLAKICLSALVTNVLLGKIAFPIEDKFISAAFFSLMVKQGIAIYCKGFE